MTPRRTKRSQLERETNDQGPPDVIETAAPAPGKTPFFQAAHAPRYQRQAIIKRIQDLTGRKLICYVCGSDASIDRDHTIGFVDLLHNVPAESEIDLLLHTGGGDIDAAEKLVSLVRAKVGTAKFRAIVPDFAKSAGTLMVLGADCIVMSDTSELGPIDPQVTLADANGNRIRHSVQNYLDAYETHKAQLEKNPEDVAAQIMLGKLDPSTIKLFAAIRNRALTIAEVHLSRGMFKYGGNSTKTASELLDTRRWQSHSQMISWRDAKDARLGLAVDFLDQYSEEWQGYWQLYCLQRLAINDGQTLFESDYASLVMDRAL